MKTLFCVRCLLLYIFLTAVSYAAPVDLHALVWETDAPDVITNGASVIVGVEGNAQTDQQIVAKHFASALLPPASAYSVTFSVNLSSWDSYNAPGTVNPPPFDGGTGYWDSFSVSINDKQYWKLPLTDPLTVSELGDNFFLWGGASYGSSPIETKSEKKITRTFAGNPHGDNYLNVGLDTATSPDLDTNYPSWGTFQILSIDTTYSDADIPRIAGITKYMQTGKPWGKKPYAFMNKKSTIKKITKKITISQDGCAITSIAMVLSKYGYHYDPGTINQKFKDGGGYTTGGDVIWTAVSKITHNRLEAKMTFVGAKINLASAKTLLDAELSDGRPVILGLGGHFVVAVGRKTNGVYEILDPYFPKRSTLAPYGNKFRSMIRFVHPGSGAFVVEAGPGVEILVTDPLGRRVGFLSGSVVNEIPGAAYGTEGIKNDDPSLGGAAVAAHRVLFIPAPPDGYYGITATSTVSGTAIVKVYRYNIRNLPETVQTLDLTANETTTESIPYSIRVGDVNGDGYINMQDLELVEASFGKRVGQPGYNPAADVNGDDVVNVRDLAIVGRFDPPPQPLNVPER